MRVLSITSYDESALTRCPRYMLGKISAASRLLAALSQEEISLARECVPPPRNFSYAKAYLREYFHGRRVTGSFPANFDPDVLRAWAHRMDATIRRHNPSVVFFPENLWAIGFLTTRVPIVLWSDCLSSDMLRSYAIPFHPRAMDLLRAAEASTLARCSRILCTSQWMADSVLRLGIPKSCVDTLCIFPGLACADRHTGAEIGRWTDARAMDPVFRVLFVGSDWVRKGGSFAALLHAALRKKGIEMAFTFMGDIPDLPAEPFLRILRGRRTAEDIHQELTKAHIVLLPSKAECCTHFIADASGHGVPVLVSDVGGNATAVADGTSGYLFSPTASVEEYAQRIMELSQNRSLYRSLSLSAYAFYVDHLRLSLASQGVLRAFGAVTETPCTSRQQHS